MYDASFSGGFLLSGVSRKPRCYFFFRRSEVAARCGCAAYPQLAVSLRSSGDPSYIAVQLVGFGFMAR